MIESFFEWCETTALGTAVRDSVWAFPAIEAVHLLGLCVLGGALLVVDLRLLGAGLTEQSPAALARRARPWLIGSIAVLVTTGIPLFLSEAVKVYYNTAFWTKMATIPTAVVFTFGVRDRLLRSDALDDGVRSRLVGATSIALWLVVAAAGRWIGYS